ncbi:hypothetical protein Tco_1156631 [Tanacetum coccineum]
MVATMKHMVVNFSKLDMLERIDFRRWQKKMHFFLTNMSVVYVLNTPIPEDRDYAFAKQIRKKSKWENDDYVCRGLILNETKYMVEDASSEKFIVSNFNNYKIVDSRPVMEQYNELSRILEQFTQHKSFRIKESLREWENDKPKSNNVIGLSIVNMVEHNNSTMYNDNKGKCKHQSNTKVDPSKKSKLTY